MSKILWIDDDYQALRGLMMPLEQAGHEIDFARDITSALEKLHGEVLYELAIVDVILPRFESPQASLPKRIQQSLDAGVDGGEALIEYIRRDLRLRIPIIVMSVKASDGQLRDRLELCLISGFLEKASLLPQQVKEAVEEVLAEVDLERAVILDLLSDKREEREAGLRSAEWMKPSRNLYRALVGLAETEMDPELRKLAASILQSYPTDLKEDLDSGDETASAVEDLTLPEEATAPDTQVAKQPSEPPVSARAEPYHPGTVTPKEQAVRVLLLVLGMCGVAVVAIALSWWAKSFTPLVVLIALVLIAVAVLGAMGILSSDQILDGFRDALSVSTKLRRGESSDKDTTSDENEQTPPAQS